MGELTAIHCAACGGTVRLAAGTSVPKCMFCGADASDLAPAEEPEGIEQPEGALPFQVDEAAAREAFLDFAGSSRWYPNDLSQARVEMRALWFPAWAWSGHVETHWTGLVSAATASGKRPTAGEESVSVPQVLVPSSSALKRHELQQLGPFAEEHLAPVPDDHQVAIELSELTRSMARTQAHAAMCQRHASGITASHGLSKIKPSSLVTELVGRPVLLPVWIGAYRYRNTPYRILVHGQTGNLVGDAPISIYKVVLAVVVVLGILGAIGLAILACMGGGGIVAAIAR
jgi:hypothetical protein